MKSIDEQNSAPALQSTCGCCTPRRKFLSALGGLGAGSMLLPGRVFAQPKAAKARAPARRIDVHHHFAPPFYAAEAKAAGYTFGLPWTLEGTLDDMEKGGVAKSIISISQPSTWIKDEAKARSLVREANEYGAKMRVDDPKRFGVFTMLPMPDIAGSLAEIEYGLDTLKSDGIGMFTSYGNLWLGDPALRPVLEELNRRKALVYVHPSSPACCTGLQAGIDASTIEFATDTTRTIASLLFSGSANRFPDIRWIWSHSGGTMPYLFSRFERQEELMKGKAKEVLPRGSLYELKRFYYETAQGNTAMQLSAILKMIPVSNLLFGSDYPYRPASMCAEGLAAYGFKPADLRSIEYENAFRLMPQLKA